jgi:hypothetical protein
MSDMAEHRVPVLGGSLHRYVDPSLSSDPRIRELVAALSTLEVAPAPRAHFRAELRSQLVAVAPRLVSEGPAELVRHTPETVAAAEAQPSRVRTLASRIPHLRLGRPVRLVAVALTVIAMAMSGAVWLSRSALPGDALYGLKRASENAQFSLTSGNVPRGKELLSFAKTRVNEVSDLLSNTGASGAGIQASGGVSSSTASLVKSTLASADDDVRQASQLLGAQAVHDKSSSPLAVMINWAPEQMKRLGQVVARTPSGPVRDRVMSSAKLLSDAYTRAQALKALQGCSCLNNASTDSLGPVPCQVCTGSTPTTPTQQHTNQPGNSTSTKNGTTTQNPGKGTPTGTNAPTKPNNPTQTSNPTTPGSTDSSTPGLPLPTSLLPTLPLPSTPPLTVDSCGAGVTVGPIGVGVGTCGVHIDI